MTSTNTTMTLSQAEAFVNGIIAMSKYEDQMAASYENKMGAAGTVQWQSRFDDPTVVEAVRILLDNGKQIPAALGFTAPVQEKAIKMVVFNDGQAVQRYDLNQDFSLYDRDPMILVDFAEANGVLKKDTREFRKDQIMYFVAGNPGDMDYCPWQQGLYLGTGKNYVGDDVHYVLSRSENKKNGHWCVYAIYGSEPYCTSADALYRWGHKEI